LSNIVKAVALVLLATTLGASPVLAEATQCKSIKVRKDRNACVERQAAAKQATSASSNPQMIDAIELLRIEDDRLAKRLQGICRGC
jgi:hypothetical protein